MREKEKNISGSQLGRFSSLGDIRWHLEIFLMIKARVRGATDILWIEARDTAEYLTVYKSALFNKGLSGPKCQ